MNRNIPAPGGGAPLPTPPVHRVVVTQLAVLLPVVLALWIVDSRQGLSVLFGGLAAVLPQAWFARFVFQERGASARDRFFARLIVGEATKLSMTALLCALGFQWPAMQAGGFFLGMVGMIVLGWALTLRVLTTGDHAG